MGQIYFGEDPQLKRNVAVKVSSVSEAGEDPRFSKEAEVLAQLAHPNIVPIHNIGTLFPYTTLFRLSEKRRVGKECSSA